MSEQRDDDIDQRDGGYAKQRAAAHEIPGGYVGEGRGDGV